MAPSCCFIGLVQQRETEGAQNDGHWARELGNCFIFGHYAYFEETTVKGFDALAQKFL